LGQIQPSPEQGKETGQVGAPSAAEAANADKEGQRPAGVESTADNCSVACTDNAVAHVELGRAERETRISKIDRAGELFVFLLCAFIVSGLFGCVWVIAWVFYKCLRGK
jgi:hypothetical protein